MATRDQAIRAAFIRAGKPFRDHHSTSFLLDRLNRSITSPVPLHAWQGVGPDRSQGGFLLHVQRIRTLANAAYMKAGVYVFLTFTLRTLDLLTSHLWPRWLLLATLSLASVGWRHLFLTLTPRTRGGSRARVGLSGVLIQPMSMRAGHLVAKAITAGALDITPRRLHLSPLLGRIRLYIYKPFSTTLAALCGALTPDSDNLLSGLLLWVNLVATEAFFVFTGKVTLATAVATYFRKKSHKTPP
jgi:hypothetical protein